MHAAFCTNGCKGCHLHTSHSTKARKHAPYIVTNMLWLPCVELGEYDKKILANTTNRIVFIDDSDLFLRLSIRSTEAVRAVSNLLWSPSPTEFLYHIRRYLEKTKWRSDAANLPSIDQ